MPLGVPQQQLRSSGNTAYWTLAAAPPPYPAPPGFYESEEIDFNTRIKTAAGEG